MFIRFDRIHELADTLDGRTPHDDIGRACVASRGNKPSSPTNSDHRLCSSDVNQTCKVNACHFVPAGPRSWHFNARMNEADEQYAACTQVRWNSAVRTHSANRRSGVGLYRCAILDWRHHLDRYMTCYVGDACVVLAFWMTM